MKNSSSDLLINNCDEFISYDDLVRAEEQKRRAAKKRREATPGNSGQEKKQEAFDLMLGQAVHSSFVPAIHPDRDSWQREVERSLVRLQWDPDHGPLGEKLERRAIQLGLRGDVLARYGGEWIVAIEDISEFVAEQRARLADGPPFARLMTRS